MAKRVISNLISSSSSPKSVIPSVSFSGHHFPSSPVHHTLSESMMEEIIENAESIIRKWDTNSSSYNKVVSLFQQSKKEAREFIKCVKDLRRAMHFLVSGHGHSEKLKLAQNLMQVAMARLEKEFHQILSSNRDQLDPESVSGQSSNGSNNSEFEDDDESDDEELKKAGESISKVERSAALVMSDLKAIAECMINCGYGKECVKIYKLLRKSTIDEGLHMLDFGKHKASQIPRMNWDALDPVIKNWVKAIKIGVTTLFRGEKLLCDHVFSSSKQMRENCFYEIINEEATKLLRFPELVALRKKSPERILRLMDLYEAITEVWQDLELIFHFELVAGVRLQALSSLHKLADSIRIIVRDFEYTIQKDFSKALVPGGGIHPLTKSAIRFISSLADYSSVLSEILKKHPLDRSSSMPESYFRNQIHNNEPTRALSVHLAWLILVLLCKLDTKAALYKDVSFSYLFLTNNLNFILDEVRSSNLRNLLGDEWIQNHEKKVKAYTSNHEIAAWAKVFLTLPDKSLTMSPEAAKNCFRRFHAAFEEAYMTQSSCIVTDGKLRDELKISIANKLVPEYRGFYERYLGILSQEKNMEMLVRFNPDNLENYISDLFHGTPIVSGYSSSSSSSSSCSSQGCLRG